MENEKILVVDDEADILELVAFNLQREGCAVFTAPTGEEAMRLAREQQPHLMVLDLMLPGMDGLEVTRQLKADSRTKNIQIVMLTAKGEEADIVAGLELGADDYITKPFSPRVLVARVKAVLRRKEKAAVDEEGVVRGEDYNVTDRSVDVQIAGLRKKLGPAGRYVETVRGVGYRFKE